MGVKNEFLCVKYEAHMTSIYTQNPYIENIPFSFVNKDIFLITLHLFKSRPKAHQKLLEGSNPWMDWHTAKSAEPRTEMTSLWATNYFICHTTDKLEDGRPMVLECPVLVLSW